MKRTVLVVASASTMRLLLESTLSSHHWRVAQASSMSGATAVLALVKVNVLLIDLTGLERREALDLCRSTRRDLGAEQTRIVALACPEEIDKIGKDLRRQIDVLLQKPFSPSALLDWIYASFPDEGQGPPRSSTGVA